MFRGFSSIAFGLFTFIFFTSAAFADIALPNATPTRDHSQFGRCVADLNIVGGGYISNEEIERWALYLEADEVPHGTQTSFEGAVIGGKKARVETRPTEVHSYNIRNGMDETNHPKRDFIDGPKNPWRTTEVDHRIFLTAKAMTDNFTVKRGFYAITEPESPDLMRRLAATLGPDYKWVGASYAEDYRGLRVGYIVHRKWPLGVPSHIYELLPPRAKDSKYPDRQPDPETESMYWDQNAGEKGAFVKTDKPLFDLGSADWFNTKSTRPVLQLRWAAHNTYMFITHAPSLANPTAARIMMNLRIFNTINRYIYPEFPNARIMITGDLNTNASDIDPVSGLHPVNDIFLNPVIEGTGFGRNSFADAYASLPGDIRRTLPEGTHYYGRENSWSRLDLTLLNRGFLGHFDEEEGPAPAGVIRLTYLRDSYRIIHHEFLMETHRGQQVPRAWRPSSPWTDFSDHLPSTVVFTLDSTGETLVWDPSVNEPAETQTFYSPEAMRVHD